MSPIVCPKMAFRSSKPTPAAPFTCALHPRSAGRWLWRPRRRLRAAALNGGERLELLPAQTASAHRVAVVADDVRDLDVGHDDLEVQILERSLDLVQQVGGDMAVTHGVGDLLVSQQHLNHADIDMAFEQVGGEGMA
jgi:hypothetical protein